MGGSHFRRKDRSDAPSSSRGRTCPRGRDRRRRARSRPVGLRRARQARRGAAVRPARAGRRLRGDLDRRAPHRGSGGQVARADRGCAWQDARRTGRRARRTGEGAARWLARGQEADTLPGTRASSRFATKGVERLVDAKPRPRIAAPGGHGALLDAATTYLDLDRAALVQKLRGGSSLAEIAVSQGKTRDGLKAALLDAVKAKLDARPRLTAAQKAAALAKAGEAIERVLDLKLRTDRPGPEGVRGSAGTFAPAREVTAWSAVEPLIGLP